MGSSLSTHLVYGISISTEALEEDPDTYYPLAGDWFTPPEDGEDEDEDAPDFLDRAIREYLTRKKVDLSEVKYDFQLEDVLKQHCGLEMVIYGVGDWSARILATCDASDYSSTYVCPREVLATDTAEWDRKLLDFVTELGLQPKQKTPEWMVCASYG